MVNLIGVETTIKGEENVTEEEMAEANVKLLYFKVKIDGKIKRFTLTKKKNKFILVALLTEGVTILSRGEKIENAMLKLFKKISIESE